MSKMSVQQAHEMLGHITERATKEISKTLGWLLTDNQPLNCAAFAAEKAKQSHSRKSASWILKMRRMDTELTWIFGQSRRAKKYPITMKPNWRMIVVGTQLQLKFSHFYKSKDGMVETTCELLHWWKQNGQKIQKLHMDNAGKNKKLKSRLQSAAWKTTVVIEYTARDTPQQNSPVEVAFYALANRACATMHHMNLPMEMRY